MKSHPSSLVGAALIFGMSVVHAATIESFESGTLNGWNPGTLNGVSPTVDSVHVSDGSFGAAATFTVPASFSGWTVNTIIDKDPRTFMDAGATSLSIDVYSDWANPNGWGVYGNTIMLVLNNSDGWNAVAPTSGSLVNGAFSTLTWDMTPHAAAITDAGLGYSSVGLAWHVGTWAGDGGGATYTENGTQTLAIDNIQITAVPEPGVAALGGLSVLGLLIRKRR